MKNDKELINSLEDELQMLSINIEKAKEFIAKRYMLQVDDFTIYLLKKQLRHMKQYRGVLSIRLKYAKSRAKEREDIRHVSN
ncbi:hypothetical protein DKZ34_04550 [Limosilactobacillus reuteri]|uniref:crAss001_48 related protein n=1 Tax=Limosilactobacillus reuteri TaxID=1598 RepID=UPI000D7012F5|nr:hypothetical protein [Limosilactobacillus reuteri]PWT40948.1 hypothetical protein DKZ34_04550 [Limosilactobacillus reuteri]